MMKLKGIANTTTRRPSTTHRASSIGSSSGNTGRCRVNGNGVWTNMKKEKKEFDKNKHYTVTESEDMCTLHGSVGDDEQTIRRPSAPPLHNNNKNIASRRANEIWVSSTRSSVIAGNDDGDIDDEDKDEETRSQILMRSKRYINCDEDFEEMCKMNSVLNVVDKTIKLMSRLKEALKWGSASFCVIACSVLIICLL